MEVPHLVMPKKGKLKAWEKEEELQKKFRNSETGTAVEPNINQ